MKNRILAVLMTVSIALTICPEAKAEEQPTLIKGFATAYNGPSDYTCTGKPVHKGICGGCQEYIGKTIILYQRLPGDEIGQIIGIYECEDTGPGTDGFREGRVIDVWMPEDECQDFMNLLYTNNAQGKCFIQVLEDCNG
jgi:hypothetical protein